MPFNRKILNRIIVICSLCIICLNLSAQEQDAEETRITALIERVKNEGRVVDELSENNLTNLPIGIKKTISGTTVIIAIDSALITPDGMIISAYTQLIFPEAEKFLTFSLKGAIITPAGLSSAGPTHLELISNLKIPINSQITLALPADGGNYVEWDCNGFKSVNLRGKFEFSEETFIPVDKEKTPVVTALFEVNTTDLNNILVSTSITPFRIKGMKDMTFTVRNAVLDMSDYVNCDGFVFPPGYQFVFNDAPALWRGFFLKDISILLPSELSNAGQRTEIIANNLLIDDFGISGNFAAENLITIDKGSASGWPFSVSSLGISLVKNRITAGQMAGMIKIPFLGDEPIGYAAQITSSVNGPEYMFSIIDSVGKEFNVPFGGKVKLDKGCVFEVRYGNGEFIPSAILNGTLFLAKEDTKIEGLRFEQLHILAESPYITGGKFDVAGSTGFHLAGFSMSIDSITLAFSSGKASLGMNALLAVMNKTDKGVSASTRFFIKASLHEVPDPELTVKRTKWEYDGIQFAKINIEGNVSVFSLSGQIDIMKNDSVYGNGLHGKVKFTAGKVIKNPAEVEIYFGNKPDFRYWFTKIEIPTNIPIGFITLNSLGGGAYSNMEKVYPDDPESIYKPKKDNGMGLLAIAGLCVKSDEVFHADVELEIAINTTGGLKFISFTGAGRFFSASTKQGTTPGTSKSEKEVEPAVTAFISMKFDNEHDSFHSNFQVFMNIADAIKGKGPNNLLGESVIHCDSASWYVYVGRPSAPLGVNIAGILEAQTYFMAGTTIENMPLPPSEVASIMTGVNTDFMHGENGVASGKGVAFGVRVKASTGIGQNSGFVYAYLNGGAGTDIMLQNYGIATCEGRSGPIGINGWYASGQGYSYLIGTIGIRIKKSKFDIMSVSAAMLMQAKMPNPSWFSGNIAARYSVLGGLVKGKVNVSVVLGEECVLVSNANPLGDLKIIGDVSPAGGNTDVDVFTAPQVSFNAAINKEFGMLGLNDVYSSYRVVLDEFKIKTSDNQNIDGTIQWNTAQDLATFKLKNILPGSKEITASVKVHIERKINSGWQAVEGDPETKSISFKTGNEPKSIPESNVAYSYPLRNQYNFYKSEYTKGYIKLDMGQENLFKKESEGISWSYIARLSTNTKSIEIPVVYDFGTATIWYDIPKELANAEVYDFAIIKRPVNSGAVDKNLQRGDVSLNTVNPGDSIRIKVTNISGTITSETETILHTFIFRTSTFSSFKEKLGSITDWKNLLDVDNGSEKSSLILIPHIRGTVSEVFDKYETEGSKSILPLISLKAKKGNQWIDEQVFPLIYELYGQDLYILERNTEVLGIFPERAVYLYNSTESPLALSKDAQTISGTSYLKYMIPITIHYDFYELLNKAVAKYLSSGQTPSKQALRLMTGKLTNIYQGYYPFNISYRLPGTNTITSSEDMSFKFD
jgi:hypothetical protein